MSVGVQETLLEQLNNGRPGAAEAVFAAYEPYLRMVIRRNLRGRFRAKFDSVDVVQSVWVHVLHGLRSATWKFDDPSRLRALLQTLARRRLASRFRHYQAAGERERSRAVIPERVSAIGPPRPSEIAQATELWERMLAICPAANHEVLRLRRKGHALTEIAARTGMHEGSVRRILRQLARRLSIESTARTPDDSGGVCHET